MADNVIAIGLFGRRRTGKSNLIASLGGRGQAPSDPGAVIDVDIRPKGLGAARLVVPAGLDDERALGVNSAQARSIMESIEIAIVVIDAALGWSDYEKFLLSKVRFSGRPVIAIVNRARGEDSEDLQEKLRQVGVVALEMDLSRKADSAPLVSVLAAQLARAEELDNLVEGLVGEGDLVWLVVPNVRPSSVDPVGPAEVRLAKDAVICGATISIIREGDFARLWNSSGAKPNLIVADATVFSTMEDLVPDAVRLTSLGMLVSRRRGELDMFVRGAHAISTLQAGDRVLIAEACQLHVQPEDIARSEIPNLLRKWIGGDLEFSSALGGPAFEGIGGYKLVVRCGACMLDREAAIAGLKLATDQGVPVTTYGIALAYMHGVLDRMLQPFVDAGEIAAPEMDKSRSIPLGLHDEFSIPPCM